MLLNQVPPIAFNGVFRISLLLVVGMPLVSAILCLLLPARKPRWIMTVASALSFIGLLSACALFTCIGHNRFGEISFTWFHLGGQAFDISVMVVERTVRMLLLVMLVSFLVHVYSVAYMAGDAALKRYYAALGFFTFSMLGIVLTDNLLPMFVFWELVGFSSYMLIGHWRDRPAAAAAAKKAFIMNRIGDAGFIVGLMIFWTLAGSLDYGQLIHLPDSSWKTAAALCIFCGVIGKSAQFPLFTWLPDAMEGPTPASALIHAATMVAAGVFLLVHMYWIFTRDSLAVIAVVGLITALVAALAALAQTDLKKILAYSTVSQLGFMMLAIGAETPEAAFLHLLTHGFFKACLFLCAGSVIHALHEAQHGTHEHFDVQDIRNLGGLRRKLPFTFAAFAISGASLAGVPFFSGFLSKDAILTALLYWKGDAWSWRYIIFGGAFIVSFLTVLYTFRLIATVFLGEEQKKTIPLTVHEPSWYMRGPIALLALGSCWFLVSWNPLSYRGWLYIPGWPDENFHSTILVFISGAWVLIACAVAYVLYSRRYTRPARVLLNAFYIDKIYMWVATKPTLAVVSFTEKVDRRWIDGFLHFTAYGHVTLAYLLGWFDRVIIDGAVNGMAALIRTIGSFTRSFQGGKIQLYIFWSVLAIIIFLIWTLL